MGRLAMAIGRTAPDLERTTRKVLDPLTPIERYAPSPALVHG